MNATEARNPMKGRLLATFSVIVWGTTFISSKVLLETYTPVEILFFRMFLAISALWIARPRALRLPWKRELLCLGAGLSGVTLYFLLENLALTYTYSSNCSVIISTAPFFVALAVRLFLRNEPLTKRFYIGFIVAMLGVGLVSFSGQQLRLNPLGDVLCLLAAVSWAGYSVCIRKLEPAGLDTLMMTRRIFEWGVVFLLPVMAIFGFSPDWAALAKPANFLNLLFLGLIASALCFVTWNIAVRELGAIRTSAYIYASPVVTILAAWLLLGETILPAAIVGVVLTLTGLVISQGRGRG